MWLGIDKLLYDIRDDKAPISQQRFFDLREEHGLMKSNSDPEDWQFDVVGRRIHTIVFAHNGPDARKLTAESSEKCGFE